MIHRAILILDADKKNKNNFSLKHMKTKWIAEEFKTQFTSKIHDMRTLKMRCNSQLMLTLTGSDELTVIVHVVNYTVKCGFK